jgi:NADPH-dependent 2,4-dienoyl-CoA reductase/sulfur reductase-like enzyme
MISNETDLPYDRPNLNKDYLQGEAKEEWMPLRSEKFFQNRGIELILGRNVTSVDTRSKSLAFESGAHIQYDRCCWQPKRPRHWMSWRNVANIFTLRSFADSGRSSKACEMARAVIVGASFIGLESASSLRKRGLPVTVVAPETVLFERIFGTEIGSMLRQAHEENGVAFQLGTAVERFEGEGSVKTVVLKNGIRIDADVVLIGIGVRPNTGYLKDIPKEADGSIHVDSCFRAADNVYAAGDIASIPDWRRDTSDRLWRTAGNRGRDAALNGREADCERQHALFWTNRQISIRCGAYWAGIRHL